ncbi:TlpA family protein disulfide reductase [Mucisphaera sp.]|uniref:TlpA family protein disulfide reductase n=1 Tax=Mucisphaera sp. TaxID=2913024 RepID=UPI003D10866C
MTRPLALLCSLALILLTALPAAAQEANHPLLGRQAPPFTLPNMDGEPLRLNQLKGEIVVLDFWATWCPPCVAAMPELQKLHERYADQGVRIIGVNLGEDRATAQRFIDQKNLTFDFVLDERRRTSRPYRISGIPQTVFIDREGIVQAVHVGFGPNSPAKYAREIDALLAGQSLVQPNQPEPTNAAKARTQILEPVNTDKLVKTATIYDGQASWFEAPLPGTWFEHPSAGKILALFGDNNELVLVGQTPEGTRVSNLPLELPIDANPTDFAITGHNQSIAVAAVTAETDLDGSLLRMQLIAFNNRPSPAWSADLAPAGKNMPVFTVRFAELANDDTLHVAFLADYEDARRSGELARHTPEVDAAVADNNSTRLLSIFNFETGEIVYRGWIPGPTHGGGFYILPANDNTQPDSLLIATDEGFSTFNLATPQTAEATP